MGNTNDAPNNNINNIHNNKQNQGLNDSPEALLSLLGNTFITNDGLGDKTFAKGIAPNQIIGLYFSGQWCAPCRQFTPYLKQLYEQWKQQNHKIEIVFISRDKSYDEFKSYFTNHHGNWLALPFGSKEITQVDQKFQVRGIPALIFIDAFGNIIEPNGTKLVSTQQVGAIDILLNSMPEIKPKAFHGTAHSLKDNNNNNNNNNNNGDQISMYDYISGKELKIFDDNDEIATIQIVLTNGKKQTIKMNMNKQNVGDLFAHVKFLNDCGAFQLLAGFPPKVLKDETVTVKEAQLKGARVTQKKL
eukprot:240844_1